MKAKFDPAVYAALQAAGHSNREAAKLLGVSEAAVRRGLKEQPSAPSQARTFLVTVEAAPQSPMTLARAQAQAAEALAPWAGVMGSLAQ